MWSSQLFGGCIYLGVVNNEDLFDYARGDEGQCLTPPEWIVFRANYSKRVMYIESRLKCDPWHVEVSLSCSRASYVFVELLPRCSLSALSCSLPAPSLLSLCSLAAWPGPAIFSSLVSFPPSFFWRLATIADIEPLSALMGVRATKYDVPSHDIYYIVCKPSRLPSNTA